MIRLRVLARRTLAAVGPFVLVACASAAGETAPRAADAPLVHAAQVAAEKRWVEGAQALDVERWVAGWTARQTELYLEAAARAEAERAAAAAAIAAAKARVPKPAPVVTGRVGGSAPATSPSVGGACGGATNGADAYIGRESGGNPNARNASGAWGCYQIMPGTWSSGCSDLGQHGSASPSTQAQCASRLPQSSWSSSGPTR